LIKYFYGKNKNYLKLLLPALIIFTIIIITLAVRNLYLYNYPYVEGLNLFFKPLVFEKFEASWMTDLFKTISPVRPSLQIYTSTFGWLAFILFIFGLSMLISNWNRNNKNENNLLFLLFLSSLTFLSIFNITYYTGYIPLETRYLSIIFPQLVMLGGFFLWKMKEWNKYLLIVIIPILLFSLWTSITVAQETFSSQRYPSDYLEALNWVKVNTPKDAIIFTTYSGSLKYYGDRDSIWNNIKYFPDVMTTNNGTFIYNNLRNYNISYILIWRSTMAQNYVIPSSNLWGAFTYNFANVVAADTSHFDLKFSNDNNWIFELKQLNQTNQSK